MSDPYRSVPEPQQQAPGAEAGISQADLIAGAGALITFIFSFLAFYEAPGPGPSRNAWDTDTSAFASTIPALLALALVVVVALGFAKVTLPERVITFTWDQIKATWGISAAGIMIAFIATGPEGIDKGLGFWFMLIGSLIMAAGTIMKLLGKGTSAVAVGTPSSAPTGGSATTPPPPPSGSAPPPPPPAF